MTIASGNDDLALDFKGFVSFPNMVLFILNRVCDDFTPSSFVSASRIFETCNFESLIFRRGNDSSKIHLTISIAQADVCNVFGMVAMSIQRTAQCWRQLCVDDEPHDLACNEHGVTYLCGGMCETGGDVFGFEIGVVLKDFRLGDASGQ